MQNGVYDATPKKQRVSEAAHLLHRRLRVSHLLASSFSRTCAAVFSSSKSIQRQRPQ
jgi:hypothetical protein